MIAKGVFKGAILLFSISSFVYVVMASMDPPSKYQRMELTREMQGVSIAATDYLRINGALPTKLDAKMKAEVEVNVARLIKESNLKIQSRSADKWLIFGTAESEKESIEKAKHIGAAQIFYCPIKEGKNYTAFRVLAKDYQGSIISVGEQPLMLGTSP